MIFQLVCAHAYIEPSSKLSEPLARRSEPSSEPRQTAPPSSDHIFLARGELLELQDHAS